MDTNHNVADFLTQEPSPVLKYMNHTKKVTLQVESLQKHLKSGPSLRSKSSGICIHGTQWDCENLFHQFGWQVITDSVHKLLESIIC